MPDDEDDSSDREAHHDPEAFEDGFGDDFDDFEAGGEAEDFGDFDDAFEQPLTEPEPPKLERSPNAETPYVSSGKNKAISHEASWRVFQFSHSMMPSAMIFR